MKPILEIKDLTVSINNNKVIDDVNVDLYPGEIVTLVGESGSGKTVTSLAILDLLPKCAIINKGSILFHGKSIFSLNKEEMRCIRGNKISIVFQEPYTALNPVMKIGTQIAEVILTHGRYSKISLEYRIKELIEMVLLPINIRLQYPHELSGGMRQRVLLAIALACDPEIIILDEPTTALDVTVQKKILDLIVNIQKKRKFSILFITHDFSIVKSISNKICVMKNGRIVEKGSSNDIFNESKHEYTKHLLDCIPRLGDTRQRLPRIKGL